MTYTDEELQKLAELVKPYYAEKRYQHALSVSEEAGKIGKIMMPERVSELEAAGLLHDITKKYDSEKQLQCCEKFGIIVNKPVSVEVLHSFTGAAIAKQDFPYFVNDDIYGAIKWHTTGHYGMSDFEAIVFLADYIEPTRQHTVCIEQRQRFYSYLGECAADGTSPLKALDRAVYETLDNTVKYLLEKNSVIDIDTVSARNYYLVKNSNA